MLARLSTVAVYSTKKFGWIEVVSDMIYVDICVSYYLQYFPPGHFGQGSQEDKKQSFVHIFAHLVKDKPSKNIFSLNQ